MARLGLRACFLLATVFGSTVVAACGGGSTHTGMAADAGGIPAPGTATLAGAPAFDVTSATMGIPTPGACGGGGGSSSVISQVTILLASQGLPSLCADGGVPEGGVGEWLYLALATTQAATGAPELTESLTAGTYAIGDEGEDDPDVCMLPPGTNAFLEIATPEGDDAQATAISGTVTLDSISAGSVTGTFSVLMGGPEGTTDTNPPPSLTGTFNALACP